VAPSTPLYRRPRKIWGIGLNYVGTLGDLSETALADERRASCARIPPSGPGMKLCCRASPSVTAEGEFAIVIGREAKDVSEE